MKRSSNSIDKPSNNETIGYWLSNMRTWHYKHKEVFISHSCKDVKIKSVTLLSIVMSIVEMIQVNITSSW